MVRTQFMQGDQAPDISSLRGRLAAICRELGELLPALLARPPMFQRLYQATRRCGKSSCACAHDDAVKHPFAFLTVEEGRGKTTCTLDTKLRLLLELFAEEHRRFREARALGFQLMKEAQSPLQQLEAAGLVPLERILAVDQ